MRDQSWEETVERKPGFAKKWLQELVLHREDLAMLALRLNASRRAQGLKNYGVGYEEDPEEDDDDDFVHSSGEL